MAALDVGAVLVGVILAVGAGVLALVVGIPVGWLAARRPGWTWVRPVVLVPAVVPPLVGALVLGVLPVSPGPSPAGTAAAVGLLALAGLPLVVLPVEAAARAIPPGIEEVMAVHGLAGAWRLRRIVPLAAPGIRVGAGMALARALGEVGVALALAAAPSVGPPGVWGLDDLTAPAVRPSAVTLLVLAVAVVVGVGVAGRASTSGARPEPGR